MPPTIAAIPAHRPPLHPAFQPASLWNREYRALVRREGGEPLALALERGSGQRSVFHTAILPATASNRPLNQRYAERLLKFLLWQKGGFRVTVCGPEEIAAYLRSVYAQGGERGFDAEFMGARVYGQPFTIEHAPYAAAPAEQEAAVALGRHLQGCRIGFDLGASDRKFAAVIDGQVVFSGEIPWNPGAEADPQFHFDGIQDCLLRAAQHLPRVDAIGGSSAGVLVNNETRVASLFRSVPPALFESRVRGLYGELRRAWNGVPFEVVNDGEVTALEGSMAVGEGAVLGVAMGSSMAAGYVTPRGNITTWLNELAFAPVDYHEDAAADEWSGDRGAGVQYFSQQAVGRLLGPAGIALQPAMPLPEKLENVQRLMEAGDERAARIYETIGVYFGWQIAHLADFYDFRHVLSLGRVMTGVGGEIILSLARQTLKDEFPELGATIHFHMPGEEEKRHGQAIAAASLPALPR